MEMLQDFWDLECAVDPVGPLCHGMKMDTVLVCNDGYPDEHSEFFKRIDGAETHSGRLYVLQRENTGLSFGAYAHVFEKFHDEYDYWMFSEDDFIQTKSGYLPAYLEELRTDGTGFVASVGIAKYHDNEHAHGGCGFTSRAILDLVAVRHSGRLPYANMEPSLSFGRHSGKPVYNHKPFCDAGEVPLTNTIVQMGYKLGLVTAYTDAYYDWKHNEEDEDSTPD